MAHREEVTEKVLALAERAASREGIEVVDVEFLGGGRSRLLRVYIDKPGGVTHADCEKISVQLGTVLDVEDAIPGGSYTLEVSSPGVERKLRKPREFERFIGHNVKVVLRQPVESRRQWVGALKGFAGGVVTLEPEPGKTVQFPLEQVEKANLKFEW
ncbi:MAG TPA: ribosome maturation factor RimP [Bryobacteraceae bacterium]|nr:ribosome maturation factor RimP [Bryobacteraceae bacterium]